MRDGLVAKIDLPDPDETPKLLAPRSALLRRDGHPEVFVVDRDGGEFVARSRRLRTGRSQGEFVEILEGLSEGDEVVYAGHFALEDGAVVVVDGVPSPVKVAPQAPAPPTAPAPAAPISAPTSPPASAETGSPAATVE